MHDTGYGTALSADALDAIAQGVYGALWQSAMARDLNIALRTVQRWRAEGIGKPVTADRIRLFLAERRLTAVAGPDGGLALSDILGPRIEALVAAAEDAGWDRAEIVQAIMDVVGDPVRDAPEMRP